MKMYKVYCFTNLDLYHEDWPDEMPYIPRVGEYIQSMAKHEQYDGLPPFQLKLEVVQVTYKYSFNDGWYAMIEMHVPKFWSESPLRNFYEWYAHLVRQPVSRFI